MQNIEVSTIELMDIWTDKIMQIPQNHDEIGKKVRHQVYEKFCMQRKLKLNFALCNIEKSSSTIGLESLKAVKCDWLHLCNKQHKIRETQNCCTGHLLKLVLI